MMVVLIVVLPDAMVRVVNPRSRRPHSHSHNYDHSILGRIRLLPQKRFHSRSRHCIPWFLFCLFYN